jgi:tetratricopeptide (TPR) repeat protein
MDVGLLLFQIGKTDSGKVILNGALANRLSLGTQGFLDASRVYAVLGKPELAIEYFKKALDLGFAETPWIRLDPFLDYVREVPEFREAYNELVKNNERIFYRIKDHQGVPFSLTLMD